MCANFGPRWVHSCTRHGGGRLSVKLPPAKRILFFLQHGFKSSAATRSPCMLRAVRAVALDGALPCADDTCSGRRKQNWKPEPWGRHICARWLQKSTQLEWLSRGWTAPLQLTPCDLWRFMGPTAGFPGRTLWVIGDSQARPLPPSWTAAPPSTHLCSLRVWPAVRFFEHSRSCTRAGAARNTCRGGIHHPEILPVALLWAEAGRPPSPGGLGMRWNRKMQSLPMNIHRTEDSIGMVANALCRA